MTKLSGKKKKIIDQKSILLQILCWFKCKIPFFISTIIFKSNGNGNVYLNLAFFLAQNGEGTVTVQERKNYCNENT